MSSEENNPPESESHEADFAADRFSRGSVHRFFPKNRYGFVTDRHGRDVYFHLDEVRFVGDKDHRDLREGQEVGYDLGWTSRGEHIVKLKIY